MRSNIIFTLCFVFQTQPTSLLNVTFVFAGWSIAQPAGVFLDTQVHLPFSEQCAKAQALSSVDAPVVIVGVYFEGEFQIEQIRTSAWSVDILPSVRASLSERPKNS